MENKCQQSLIKHTTNGSVKALLGIAQHIKRQAKVHYQGVKFKLTVACNMVKL